jgi:hypothetical protein
MYKVYIHGLIVECESLAALREVIGAYAGQVGEISADDVKLRPAREPARTKSKASGPAKSWAMAKWYGVKEGISTTIARATIAEIKRKDFSKYRELEGQFLGETK